MFEYAAFYGGETLFAFWGKSGRGRSKIGNRRAFIAATLILVEGLEVSFGLELIKAAECAGFVFQEVFLRAVFFDFAFFKHDYPIHIF